jgi:hypothetical protein
VITADEKITDNTDVSKLFIVSELRDGENKLSPIEAYITLFPEKKIEIFNNLKPK